MQPEIKSCMGRHPNTKVDFKTIINYNHTLEAHSSCRRIHLHLIMLYLLRQNIFINKNNKDLQIF